MYTRESLQKTFEIPNNNLDVKFEKAHHNHNNEILPNSDAQEVFRPIPGLFSCAVPFTQDKIF